MFTTAEPLDWKVQVIMNTKMIYRDLMRNKAVTISIIAFITIAATLLSMAAILGTNLFGAIDRLMQDAKTPHFMQMHSGDLDLEQLENFAMNTEDVAQFQVLPFLGIDNDKIQIEGGYLTDSLQDNGFCTQSKQFDFLLDMEGNRVNPANGELYVPVFYSKDNTIKQGDTVVVNGITFTVAGFVRDSQMNSALAYSKRFVVSENDYSRLKPFGTVEQLIEFRLKDIDSLGGFTAAYSTSGMPASGPAITWPLFRMLSAISDGIMIAVILLVSLLIIMIALLCVRFTLLAKMEEDYREIGTMKAIGMRLADIRRLYLLTYGSLGAMGCVLGQMISLLFYKPILKNIRLNFGNSGNHVLPFIISIILVFALFCFILLYVRANLRRFRKLSAVHAIRFGVGGTEEKAIKNLKLTKSKYFGVNFSLGLGDVFIRKRLYVIMLVVVCVAAFIIIVPQNLYHTISSKDFVSYMGVGRCDLRMDIQQTENMKHKTSQIAEYVSSDSAVSFFSILTTKTFPVKLDNGDTENIKVELGDHDAFPISCVEGRMPLSEQEIALSSMNAEAWEKGIGDSVTLITSEGQTTLTVCGVYSDITNGGKTAKAIFADTTAPAAWSVVCVSFTDPLEVDQRLSEYKDEFQFARVTSIDDYITQTFGQTLSSVKTASFVSVVVALAITLLVILLFLKLLIAKDRYNIAVMKVMGFTNTDIKRQFAWRMVFVLLLGIVLGTVLAGTLGEKLAAMAISSFGAAAFSFEVNLIATYLFCPVALLLTALLAIAIGTKKMKEVHISDAIKEL